MFHLVIISQEFYYTRADAMKHINVSSILTAVLNMTSQDVHNMTSLHARTPACKENKTDTDNLNEPFKSYDALLYIVVVLLFYAFSMVILMVKYIRREREEAEMANYYSEYVCREKFKAPKYELQNYMRTVKLNNPTLMGDNLDSDDDYTSCNSVPIVTDQSKCCLNIEAS